MQERQFHGNSQFIASLFLSLGSESINRYINSCIALVGCFARVVIQTANCNSEIKDDLEPYSIAIEAFVGSDYGKPLIPYAQYAHFKHTCLLVYVQKCRVSLRCIKSKFSWMCLCGYVFANRRPNHKIDNAAFSGDNITRSFKAPPQ